MEKIGLIGFGSMGRFYAQRLLRAGFTLTVMDIDPRKVEHAISLGANAASSPKEVAQSSKLVLLAVPGSREVETVMEGDDGVLSGLGKGQLVINTSTTHPKTNIHYERECSLRGAGYVDALVT